MCYWRHLTASDRSAGVLKRLNPFSVLMMHRRRPANAFRRQQNAASSPGLNNACDQGTYYTSQKIGFVCWQDKEWHMSARSFVANEKVIEIADRWLVRNATCHLCRVGVTFDPELLDARNASKKVSKPEAGTGWARWNSQL